MSPEIKDALDSGKFITCPCCDQNVKLYARRIYRSMWKWLHIIKNVGASGISGRDLAYSAYTGVSKNQWGGDYSKLVYWELVEEKDNKYYITQKGLDFLADKIEVPKYAYIYNNKVYGYSAAQVSAKECRDRFDLADVMNPANLAA